MKRNKLLFLLVIMIFCLSSLINCGGTKTIIKDEGNQINFKQFKTIKLVVVDEINNDYSKGAIPLFDGLLKTKLISMGFRIIEENPELIIELAIIRADPGNKTLRMIVGFGTGQVRIGHRTAFKDKEGKTIAEFSGWEGEFMKEQIQWGADRLRLELVMVCVDKIAKFIRTGKEIEAQQ
jgi:hypothetical protein